MPTQDKYKEVDELIPNLNQLACDMFDNCFEMIPEKRELLVKAINKAVKESLERQRETIIKGVEGMGVKNVLNKNHVLTYIKSL